MSILSKLRHLCLVEKLAEQYYEKIKREEGERALVRLAGWPVEPEVAPSNEPLVAEAIRDILMMFRFERCDEFTKLQIEDAVYDQFGEELNVFWSVSEQGRPQVRFVGRALPNTTILCTL